MFLVREEMLERITIVGGGLSGLTLGIGLRQQGVPVEVWEASRYPRHRVCGEFISGRGRASLTRLGLLEGLLLAGVGSVASAAFFAGNAKVASHPLPEAALCVSRFLLDDWLAREFLRLGGELRVGARWTGEVTDGVIRASGRCAKPQLDGWRMFGLKVHARGVVLDADLEMHLLSEGYVGLCRLPGGDVNICGLFRSAVPIPDLSRRWRDWLGGPVDSVLHSRLAEAKFDDDSFCSVAALDLRSRIGTDRHEWCVGDALTMIPPMTGNGMSMAFESAEMALEPLLRCYRGELTWADARHEFDQACDLRFTPRLRWASLVQRALFLRPARAVLLFLAGRSEWFRRFLFERTR
jgi:menaquinone-9 beta-reductase